jgi:alanyl-tRNA synthetase
MAYRVIADHVRTLTLALTDGAIPSNEGRGYVLRRILRRAVRYGRQKLGAKTGFVSQLVPTVVETMGDAFAELRRDPLGVAAMIREEEESFGKTLDRGIGLFDEIASAANGVIDGASAFKLYDTYGFPVDLTQLMAAERGLSVEIAGFEACMAEQKARSRAGGRAAVDADLALDGEAIARLGHLRVKPTDDTHKFHPRDIRATVRAIWNGSNFDEHTGTRATQRVGIVLDKSNFYAEMGGQVCDHGRMLVSRESRLGGSHHGGEFKVEDVRSFGGYVLHIGHVKRGELRVGDDVQLHVESLRRGQVSGHHTATHLLNHALRRVLGAGVDQKGSLVAPDKLRFDFSHPRPVEPAQIAEVERLVRASIEADLAVDADTGPLMVARGIAGLRAVFGETYPDPVRIVSIGPRVADLLDDPEREAWAEASVELCGGTHASRTGELAAFALLSEEGIAKGVRRITAVAGDAARGAEAAADALFERINGAGAASGAALAALATDLSAAVDAALIPAVRKADLRAMLGVVTERVKAEAKRAGAARAAEATAMARQIAEMAASSMEPVFVATLELGSDREALAAAMTTIRERAPSVGIMILSPDPDGGRVSVMAAVPKALIGRGLSAGEWVRSVSAVLGGKGGGKPDMAQGAGPEISKLREAAAHARTCGFAALV